MHKHMYSKVWTIVIVVLALIVGILAIVWPQERLSDIIYITRFFDVMLPILAVGALIKYLCKCCGHHQCCSDDHK